MKKGSFEGRIFNGLTTPLYVDGPSLIEYASEFRETRCGLRVILVTIIHFYYCNPRSPRMIYKDRMLAT